MISWLCWSQRTERRISAPGKCRRKAELL